MLAMIRGLDMRRLFHARLKNVPTAAWPRFIGPRGREDFKIFNATAKPLQERRLIELNGEIYAKNRIENITKVFVHRQSELHAWPHTA